MIMDKQTINKFNLAYDSMYDLDSKVNYRFKWLTHALEELETEAKKYNYEFILSQKTQKFKLKRCKE